jgi:hypothetical protein
MGTTYDLLQSFADASFVYLFGSVCLLLFVGRGEAWDLAFEVIMLCAGIGLHLTWNAMFTPPLLFGLALLLVCAHSVLADRHLWLSCASAMLWLGGVLLITSAILFGYAKSVDLHEGWALAYYNCIWAACCILLAENRPAKEGFESVGDE